MIGSLKPAKNSQEVSQLVETALKKAQSPEVTELNIFSQVLAKEARQQVAALKAKEAAGQPLGPLAGLVLAIKDNFLFKDTLTTAGAPFLADFIAPYSGTCLSRLLDQGAVLIGKTNLDAFAHGTTTEQSIFGPTYNPKVAQAVAGGSSGGSAAAVAAGVCQLALGTDTGGSVRLPASFCGVVGYKPSYGWLSRYGLVAMASSTDCPAIIASQVDEVAAIVELIAGQDYFDQTTIELAPDCFSRQLPKRSLRLGLIDQFQDKLDPVVAQAQESALKKLEAETDFEIKPISLESINLALACYYILVPAEIASNLSRYNGSLYGLSQGDLAANRSAGFLAENKRRIILGTYVLTAGYYQAYYQQAQRLRQKLVQEFATAFNQVDFLLSPVAPTTAWPVGQQLDPLEVYQTDLMTVPASLAGLPAISLPLPSQPPVGWQLTGQANDDDLLLLAAKKIADTLAKIN